MKDFTEESLREGRPNDDAEHCVDFCLRQLFKSKTKLTSDFVCASLTYEELIGALLLAQDFIKNQNEIDMEEDL